MTTRLMGFVAVTGLILSVAGCGSATPAATGTPPTTAQTDVPATTTPDIEATAVPSPGSGIGAVMPRPLLGGGGWINVFAKGSGAHILTPDGIDVRSTRSDIAFCPNLSPDGSELAFSVRWMGLFFEPLDGTRRRHIGRFNQYGYRDGVWSPDRARLAFRANFDDGGTQRLQVVSMLDDSVNTLMTTADDLIGEAAWSPDGLRLAVAHSRDGQATIDIVDLAGVRQDSIGPIPAAGWMTLFWSPDGSHLAYEVEPASGAAPLTASLVVVDLASGAQHELLSGGIGYVPPSTSPWSSDGRWIAVSDADGDLRVLSIDGLERTTVALPPTTSMQVRWSPVGDVVAVGLDEGLVTVKADGTGRTSHPALLEPGTWDFDWSPDGSMIVVAGLDRATGDLAIATQDPRAAWPHAVVASFPIPGNGAPLGEAGTGRPCVSWDAPPTAD